MLWPDFCPASHSPEPYMHHLCVNIPCHTFQMDPVFIYLFGSFSFVFFFSYSFSFSQFAICSWCAIENCNAVRYKQYRIQCTCICAGSRKTYVHITAIHFTFIHMHRRDTLPQCIRRTPQHTHSAREQHNFLTRIYNTSERK